MPLMAVTYVKGRGGATCTALGLAVAAPDSARAVLVECDPSGGDVMRWHNLPQRPSIVDFAAAVRAGAPVSDAFARVGAQQLRLGGHTVDVVAAPPGGAQVRAALPALTRDGCDALRPSNRLVVADCGRLDPASPARGVLAAADVTILLSQPRVAELAHVREHLADLLDVAAGVLVVVVTGGSGYPAGEVADVLTRHVAQLALDPDRVHVAGPLPSDRRAAGVLGGDLIARNLSWRRLPLMATLRGLVTDLIPALSIADATAVDIDPAGVTR